MIKPRTLDKKVIIGIDLGGTSIKYAGVTLEGQMLHFGKKPTEGDSSVERILQNIIEAAQDTMRTVEEQGYEVIGVGIGSPGVIDVATGKVLGEAYNLAGWNGLELTQSLSEALQRPVFADNDANLMGLGEFSYGADLQDSQVLFVTVGTGIGGAIFVDGQLYRGHRFAGGELGGLLMEYRGKVGYWEDFASTAAMVRQYLDQSSPSTRREEINGYTIFQAYLKGETLAANIVEEHGRLMGMGLASLVNVLNPGHIIIGGGISEAGEVYIQLLEKYTAKFAMKASAQDLKISAAQLGNKAGCLGAAEYAKIRLSLSLT